MDGEKMVLEAECDECNNRLESGEKVYCVGCYESLIDEFDEKEQELADKVNENEELEIKIMELEEKVSEFEDKVKQSEGE